MVVLRVGGDIEEVQYLKTGLIFSVGKQGKVGRLLECKAISLSSYDKRLRLSCSLEYLFIDLRYDYDVALTQYEDTCPREIIARPIRSFRLITK